MSLLAGVEKYLRRNGMAAARFGREVMGDAGFVFGLRRGREPRAATVARVLAWLEAHGGDR